jgi:hypothetical protein
LEKKAQSPGIRGIPERIMVKKTFDNARLEQLISQWLEGAESCWTSYKERCELVYAIWKETAKPGCKGGFSAALARMGLPDSTAYDMIFRHQIRIGEREDPAASDPRNEEEEEEEGIGEREDPAASDPRNEEEEEEEEENDPRKETKPSPSPKVVLILKGELAEAVKEIRAFHGYKDDKTTIIESVLLVRRQLNVPMLRRADGEQIAIKAGEISDAA